MCVLCLFTSSCPGAFRTSAAIVQAPSGVVENRFSEFQPNLLNESEDNSPGGILRLELYTVRSFVPVMFSVGTSSPAQGQPACDWPVPDTTRIDSTLRRRKPCRTS